MNRQGMAIFEIVALLLLLAAAWVGDTIGSRYGNVYGIIGMVVLPLLLVLAIEKLAWLERELFLGQKPFPDCRCGRGPIDSFTETGHGEKLFLRCQCGRLYDTSGRGIILIVDGDTSNVFATWKAFKGWQIAEA